MNVKIKRLFHGYASVWDYQAKEAYQKGEDLIIEYDKQYMRIPNKEIMGGAISGKPIQSVHVPGLTYSLIDYPWKETIHQMSFL